MFRAFGPPTERGGRHADEALLLSGALVEMESSKLKRVGGGRHEGDLHFVHASCEQPERPLSLIALCFRPSSSGSLALRFFLSLASAFLFRGLAHLPHPGRALLLLGRFLLSQVSALLAFSICFVWHVLLRWIFSPAVFR